MSARGVIPHYENIGLVSTAARPDWAYRDNDDKDANTLRFIRRARGLGFAIEEIGQLLTRNVQSQVIPSLP